MTSCATLTNEENVPIALSFSDGSRGICELKNKRYNNTVVIPSVVKVRRSDDLLHYDCKTDDDRTITGGIASTIGAKIVASAVFLDFGIVDSITDMHREYPASYVIPIEPK